MVTSDVADAHELLVHSRIRHFGECLGIRITGLSLTDDSKAYFTGEYVHRQGTIPRILEEAPGDKQLFAIAKALVKAQRPHCYRLRAEITHSGSSWNRKATHVNIYVVERKKWDPRIINSNPPGTRIITWAMHAFLDWIEGQMASPFTSIIRQNLLYPRSAETTTGRHNGS